MLSITLTICTLISVLFLCVGGIIGWLAKEHFISQKTPFLHPEMYDDVGNVIPDEIIAFRFENMDDYDDEDE